MNCPSCLTANDDSLSACTACGTPFPAPTTVVIAVDLKPGTIFGGRYAIEGSLGRGGMGMVYKARDRSLDEVVAIKVLRPDFAQDPKMAERFRSEIKLARKIRHKNVCAIHDYGEHQGLLYISMELVDGTDLKRLLKDSGGLPPERAYDISIQAAEGLQAVHDAGIIHRDLKTPNIMVDGRGLARLMDFGIAKRREGGGGASTATGHVLGTPEYMSPEQAQGFGLDFRSDVYALGIVVYEIFTGCLPFQGETPISTILKQLHEAPPLDHQKLPGPLRPVLQRALAKDRTARHESAHALADALRAARDASLQQRQTPTELIETPAAHAGRPPSAGRWLWIAPVVGALAVALLWRRPPPPDASPAPLSVAPPTTASAPTRTPEPAPTTTTVREPTPAPRLAAPTPTPRPQRSPGVTPAPAPAPTAKPADAPLPAPSATPAPTPAPVRADPGQLQIAVQPWAEVSVDRRIVGTTPLDRITLEAGRHVVVLTHPAYQPLQKVVTIEPGETLKLVVNLAKEGQRRQ